ncbi:MAG: hypothetical protein AAF628_06350 [Planctomycetota bacterium]
MKLASRLLALVPLALIVAVTGGDHPAKVERLQATGKSPFADTDGDQLPDALEAVLLLDPTRGDTDGDGVSDFVEAVTHELPFETSSVHPPLDHEMRAVVAIHRDMTMTEHVIVHILVRVAGGTGATAITSVTTFLDVQGRRYSIDALVGRGIANFSVRSHPVEGGLLVMSARLCAPDQLKALSPCTIGATGDIGGRTFETGNLVTQVDGLLAAATPVRDDRFVMQPLDSEPTGSRISFWSQSKVCELELVPVGSGPGVEISMVTAADCTGAPTLRCAPSCSDMAGNVFIVPFGLDSLNGR